MSNVILIFGASGDLNLAQVGSCLLLANWEKSLDDRHYHHWHRPS